MTNTALPIPRLPVACAACGWRSRRLPGAVVWCPKCGALCAFQDEDHRA